MISFFAEIKKRYTEEADNINLSCGNNIRYLDLKPGEKVLDLGCGRGAETIQAAKLVQEEGFAWGIDITPHMVDAAIKKAMAEQVINVKFIIASMAEIPLPDKSMDAVISNCAINHVNDKAAVYKEIYRLLKPGGRFVVSDIMTEIPLPLSIKQNPKAVADCFGGAITIYEYDLALRQAGFGKVQILKERNYFKNGYAMISRSFRGIK